MTEVVGRRRSPGACIAIVGCGRWGKNLLRNFAHLGALAAVVDEDEHLAAQLADQYGVPHKTFPEILQDADIEGVAIATSANCHFALGREALMAGKNVFIEKPLTLTLQDTEELWTLALRRHRILMVGHLLRYHEAFLTLLHHVKSGLVGDIVHIDAQRLSPGRVCPKEKNVFWSLAPHDISLVLALTGQLPISVKVLSENIVTCVDQGVAQLRFSNGITSRIMVSWVHPYKDQRLVVMGNQGALVFDDTAPWQRKLIFYPQSLCFHEPYLTTGSHAGTPLLEEGSTPMREPLAEECQHFVEAVADRREGGQGTVLTDGAEAMGVAKVLSAIDEAVEAMREVTVRL